MSDDVMKEFIKAVPSTIIAAGTIVTIILTWKNRTISKGNSAKIDDVKQTVNGKLGQLLENSKDAGKQEEREEEQIRKDDIAKK